MNSIDPTGLFTVAEFGAAEAIRNTLAGIQTENGGHLVIATLRGGDYTPSDFLADGLTSLVLLATIPVVVGALVTINRYVGALARVSHRAVVSKGLNKVGLCSEAAAEIRQAFISHNVSGKHIKLETGFKGGPRALIYDVGTNRTIAYSGYHEAVVVNINGKQMVYDNIYTKGKPYEKWMSDLETTPGVTFRIKEEPFSP